MSPKQTPICDFGWKARDFSLRGVDGNTYSLANVRGPKGTLIVFICNHCPYVRAIADRLIEEIRILQALGVGAVAIMPNDTAASPGDLFDKMKHFSVDHKFSFPYVIDETQETARTYGAVCTPDFFGFNAKDQLQYRGRLDELKNTACQRCKTRIVRGNEANRENWARSRRSNCFHGVLDQMALRLNQQKNGAVARNRSEASSGLQDGLIYRKSMIYGLAISDLNLDLLRIDVMAIGADAAVTARQPSQECRLVFHRRAANRARRRDMTSEFRRTFMRSLRKGPTMGVLSENYIRAYWWCKPPRIPCEMMRPQRSIGR